MVYFGLRRGMRDGLFVWLLAGRMAFWLSRGDLVDGGASTLAKSNSATQNAIVNCLLWLVWLASADAGRRAHAGVDSSLAAPCQFQRPGCRR